MRTSVFMILLMATNPLLAAGVESHVPTERFSQVEHVDLAKVARTAPVLLIGDNHPYPEIKKFISHQLPTFSALGYTVLALEMVPIGFQGDLDRWDEPARKKIESHVALHWNEKGAGVVSSIMALIDNAKACGMDVVALDPENPSINDRSRVNPFWAKRVRQAMSKHPSGRILVFGGSSHMRGTRTSLQELLHDEGLEAPVIDFSGVESPESIELEHTTAALLGKSPRVSVMAAIEHSRYGRRGTFMVQAVRPSEDSRCTCWVINLAPESHLAALPQ